MTAPARRAAHDVLRAVHTGRSDLATALDRARRRLADPRDRALAGEIAIGVQRRRAALDHLLGQAASRSLPAITPVALDLLRAAAYQLLYLDRVPAHAVVADTVELARAAGARRAVGFVNAVLRTLADRRRPFTLPAPPEIDGAGAGSDRDRHAVLDYLAITLSHPRWLVERWLDRHGLQAAEAWAQFNNRPAPVTLRANPARNTVAELQAALDAHEVRTVETKLAPHGLVVTEGDPLATPAADGCFVVQEEASQLIVELAPPAKGARVLDLCAAPGGKTVGLAGCAGPGGFVVASDLRPRRVALLAGMLARARSQRIAIVRLDATAPLPFGPAFDCVLVDAPCSGLGTLRRDPDVRWRRSPDDLAAFAATQLEMLQRAAEVVRPGGRLIYATCSSEPEENEHVVARFLQRHPGFVPTVPDTVPAVSRVLDRKGHLRTLPFRDGVEAFFAAVLARRSG